MQNYCGVPPTPGKCNYCTVVGSSIFMRRFTILYMSVGLAAGDNWLLNFRIIIWSKVLMYSSYVTSQKVVKDKQRLLCIEDCCIE